MNPTTIPGETVCNKCGQPLLTLTILAIMTDFGVRSHPSPMECPLDGKEHDFSEKPGLTDTGKKEEKVIP